MAERGIHSQGRVKKMGILKRIIGLSDGRQMECDIDSNTQGGTCRLFRKNRDNTEHTLAILAAQTGSDCKLVITEARETEEGELNILKRRGLPLIQENCQRERPEGY